MNEKSLKVLEQYEIEVTGSRRGRGSYICETNLGKKLLADFTGSEKKLRFSNRVLESLQQQGYLFADIVMENKEGNLISRDRDENTYILKDWYEGRECDTKSLQEVELAARHLAQLHKKMHLPGQPEDESCVGLDLEDELTRHNRELRKIYTFASKRKQKSEFEVIFLNYFNMFYEQADAALRFLEQSQYRELRRESLKRGDICHGSYNQHNIWFSAGREIFAGNFERCRYDVQMIDLYQFLRKIMEKQNWNRFSGNRIMEAYDRENHMGRMEREYLYIRLFYPEKFWKLANQYYNKRKTWISLKNAEKLEVLVEQQNQRNNFLKTLE